MHSQLKTTGRSRRAATLNSILGLPDTRLPRTVKWGAMTYSAWQCLALTDPTYASVCWRWLRKCAVPGGNVPVCLPHQCFRMCSLGWSQQRPRLGSLLPYCFVPPADTRLLYTDLELVGGWKPQLLRVHTAAKTNTDVFNEIRVSLTRTGAILAKKINQTQHLIQLTGSSSFSAGCCWFGFMKVCKWDKSVSVGVGSFSF